MSVADKWEPEQRYALALTARVLAEGASESTVFGCAVSFACMAKEAGLSELDAARLLRDARRFLEENSREPEEGEGA